SRRQCRKCNAIYGAERKEGKCDKCGGSLYQRDDDKPMAIKKRLDTYHKETEPLIKFYEKKLKRVNGERSIESIRRDIEKILTKD
ncbi:MAG: adenylate kinase, partial [Candidatus Aenigmarchaeota archaeon]|nr:adenylate kinase [Candidatus Aenigmarchaeota archaeon]